MSEHLPDIELSLEQEERAALLDWDVNVRPHEAARLIVHLQERVAELERHLNKADIERAWAVGKLKEAMSASWPATMTYEEFFRRVRELGWNPTAEEVRKILEARVIESASPLNIPPCVSETTGEHPNSVNTVGVVKAPFQVGDKVIIKPSTSAPRFSFLRGVISGPLAEYEYFDDEGQLAGKRLAYKVKANGQEVCAPPGMLVARGA